MFVLLKIARTTLIVLLFQCVCWLIGIRLNHFTFLLCVLVCVAVEYCLFHYLTNTERGDNSNVSPTVSEAVKSKVTGTLNETDAVKTESKLPE